jgi:translation initiation factor IF-3
VFVIAANRNSRKMPVKKDQDIINENIRAKEVLVIGPNGEQVGVRSKREALTLAEAAGLDLVLVAPNGKPPVAKIMDYGRYRYEQQRKKREAKKNQKVVQMKEVRLSPVIDIGDFNTRLKNGRKFLEKGNNVKVSVRFRGRQMAHKDIGRDVLDRFLEEVSDIADLDGKIKMEGRFMSMNLIPKKKQ